MARILKKIRGYLDFYTSYSSRFLQEITGKSFYMIFTFLNIFLLNSEKLMIIISNVKIVQIENLKVAVMSCLYF